MQQWTASPRDSMKWKVNWSFNTRDWILQHWLFPGAGRLEGEGTVKELHVSVASPYRSAEAATRSQHKNTWVNTRAPEITDGRKHTARKQDNWGTEILQNHRILWAERNLGAQASPARLCKAEILILGASFLFLPFWINHSLLQS